jgi:CubicO group peptidase (beta-lactamase class C family)
MRGAAGRSYNQIMRELVFEPAGMAGTRDDDARAVIPGRAAGYASNADGSLIRAQFRDVSENLPAGGHLSTASDLVRFANAWHDKRLLSVTSAEAMMTPTSPLGVGGAHYGFGVAIEDLAGERVIYHSGGQDGSVTRLSLSTETGRAIAWMTNYQGENAATFATEFNGLMNDAITAALEP